MPTTTKDTGLLQDCIDKLHEVGYCRIPGAYSPGRMAEALAKVRAGYAAHKDACSEHVPFLNIGQPTLYNLQNKDHYYLDLLFEPKILQDILVHFLNDQWFKQIPKGEPNYILRSFIARSSNTTLPMHLDSFVPYLGDHCIIMQLSIVLEDQNAENGCTVVVPRSHVSGKYTTQDSASTAVPIESRAGDIVIWDSRLWHGTTANTSGGTRWAIIATFCRWWMKQHWNVTGSMPQGIYEKLTDSQKAVLGFCSIPHHDETCGIDLKCGYDKLADNVEAYRPK